MMTPEMVPLADNIAAMKKRLETLEQVVVRLLVYINNTHHEGYGLSNMIEAIESPADPND